MKVWIERLGIKNEGWGWNEGEEGGDGDGEKGGGDGRKWERTLERSRKTLLELWVGGVGRSRRKAVGMNRGDQKFSE